MNSTKIITYDYLQGFNRIHVKITDIFFNKIKEKINSKYGSLKEYNNTIKIKYETLRWQFKRNIYHPFWIDISVFCFERYRLSRRFLRIDDYTF